MRRALVFVFLVFLGGFGLALLMGRWGKIRSG